MTGILLTRKGLAAAARMRFIDIGANMTDVMYQGVYNGSSRHPPDLQVGWRVDFPDPVSRIGAVL